MIIPRSVSDVAELRRLVPAFVLLVFGLAVLALMVVSYLVATGRLPEAPEVRWLITGGIGGVFIGVLCTHGYERSWLSRISEPIPKNRQIIFWFAIGILLLCAASLLDVDRFEDLKRANRILKEHGSLFDWIIGSLTVVGLWFTYETIVETQRIIRSFTQLYSRLDELIDDTKDREELHFLAFTGSIGYLALEPERWAKLSGKLRALDTRLKMICLDDEDLYSWHNQYAGRGRKGGAVLTLLETIRATKQSINVTDNAQTKKIKSESMPGYYVIFNPRRAIIVAPFFVPSHAFASPCLDRLRGNRVEMFGFETTDSRIIEDVLQLFEYYWNGPYEKHGLSTHHVGTVQQLRSQIAAQLDTWAANPALAGQFVRCRLLLAYEEAWEKIVAYLNAQLGAEKVANCLAGAVPYAAGDLLSIRVPRPEQKVLIEKECLKHIVAAMDAARLHLQFEVVVGSQGASA